MTRVLLLRHGQSTWNAEGRWQGRSDPPLSPHGEAQALAVAGCADLDGLEAAVASDLTRARHTAEIIAAGRGWGRVQVLAGLRERDVGEFTGRTRAEIDAQWPGILSRVPLDPPGGESRRAVLARALASLHRIADLHPGRAVLAVTHGALIRTVEAQLGVAEPGPPANLSGRWVTVADGHLAAGPRLVLDGWGPTDDDDRVHQVDIVGLDHVQLAMPRGAEAEAVAFYEGALGIPHVPKPEVLARRGGCWFERPPLRIHLGVEDDFRPAGKAHPALAVVGLEAVAARLRAAGVAVRPAEASVDGFENIYIDDPFGNRIELIERAPS